MRNPDDVDDRYNPDVYEKMPNIAHGVYAKYIKPTQSSLSTTEAKAPQKINSLSALVDVLGLPTGKNTSIRSHHHAVPSIYYEEESKRLNAPKGFSTLNLSYAPYSDKDLFAVYQDYKIEKEAQLEQGLIQETDILPFTYWAREHFNQVLPPANWNAQYNDQWPKVREDYKNLDLVTLTPEQRKDFEVKVINGRCYVNTNQPSKIYHSDDIQEIGDQKWGLMDSAQGRQKITNRANELIFVFAEDEKGEKKLFAASDIPGIFHHTSFNDGSLKILAAGTMEVTDGVITKITNESGHYRPSQSRFANVVEYLEDQKALSDNTLISYHKKDLITNHFSLYLVSKFEPEKCNIQGNAVILDNQNNAYFVKEGQLVKNEIKENGTLITVPQKQPGINRQGLPLCDAKDPLPSGPLSTQMSKVVHESVVKGGHFLIQHSTQNLTTPAEVKGFLHKRKVSNSILDYASKLSASSKPISGTLQTTESKPAPKAQDKNILSRSASCTLFSKPKIADKTPGPEVVKQPTPIIQSRL